MIDVFTIIGIAVVVAVTGGACIAVLVAGAYLLERFTGVPADQRRMPLESRAEHRARLNPPATPPTREDWALLGELLAAEDERRGLADPNVISLEGYRAGGRDPRTAA